MGHDIKELFTENKWYLVSITKQGIWEDVINSWIEEGITAASNAVFYNFIYKLKEPVLHGTSLDNESWDDIDITADPPIIIESNVCYFIYVIEPGFIESEPECLYPEPEQEPESRITDSTTLTTTTEKRRRGYVRI